MKKIIVLLLISSIQAWAQTEYRESHGNRDDEKQCALEIRKLKCGDPVEDQEFFSCVRINSGKLSEECQRFHDDEVDRREGR